MWLALFIKSIIILLHYNYRENFVIFLHIFLINRLNIYYIYIIKFNWYLIFKIILRLYKVYRKK